MGRPIVFLSDFGLDDGFVGICHGVILAIDPEARVLDLTHGIAPGDVLRGAVALADAAPYMPANAVYLAVVDPGVGTERRPIALEAGSGAALVGPDNGVLSLGWERLGGAVRAVRIEPGLISAPVSRTFHGRDMFAPAAAHLAAGRALADLGSPVDADGLERVSVPSPVVSSSRIETRVLTVDRYGNVQVAATGRDLDAAGLGRAQVVGVRTVWHAVAVRRAATFGGVDRGHLALIVDSTGRLAVVRNGGSAAETLRLAPGDRVLLEKPGR